ncbi:carboxypeptidase-like regulatory domain-containing protein [Flavobacterium suncheonense]|uniref:carboxypeptidase-like regulatory domain-containing protein n=1 Tax=Flavobacterium suncheonense TaxID=350894 RepID=UPI0003FCBD8A|nr:carboxypeptidase-like regulatory domain-containing protein [Flavobacterium suncheonense]
MRKLLFIFIAFLSLQLNAQTDSIKKTGWKINDKAVLRNNPEAVFVVNGTIVHKDITEVIDLKNISSVNILKNETATKAYGEVAKNGAVLITTKNISESELQKLYKLYPYTTEENRTDNAFRITGTVYDCENFPVVGATILNLNSKAETTADFDGKFSLEVRNNDILKIELRDYKSERVLIDSKKELTIKLSEIPGNIKIKVAKPVIYLYPTVKTEIDVVLDFKGKLRTTFPKYDKAWKVTAKPNGQIFDKNSKRYYSSLFWDGDINLPNAHYGYQDGFVVAKENLTSFFIEKLEHIGLINQETNDFIQFWLPILEKNEFNFIHFQINDACNAIAELNVTPKPETSLRVYMEFYGLKEFTVVKEQQLHKTERKGFTLVEWGGSEVKNSVKELNIAN